MDFFRNLLLQSMGVIIEEGVALFILLFLNFTARYALTRIFYQVQRSKGKILKENFIQKLLKPLRIMIWTVGFAYMIYIFVVRLQGENNFQQSFNQFKNVVIILCMSWLTFEVKNQVAHSMQYKKNAAGKKFDVGRIELVSKLISMLLVILTAMVTLDTLGVKIGTLIAFGGVGGIALGFAAKDVVANYFGGFMLHITRPFKIGDMVNTPNKEVEGIVEHIGYYMTVVRGYDKRPIYVPNSVFSSKVLVNGTRQTHRRIKHNIGLRYQDFNKIKEIRKEIKEMIFNHPDIDPKMHRVAEFNEFGDSSLNIFVSAYTKRTPFAEWLMVQEDVLLKAGEIIESHGAEIAFPTMTVELDK